MRDYYIRAYETGEEHAVCVDDRTEVVTAPNSGWALDRAEDLSRRYPQYRWVVSNDRGRNLAAFYGGEGYDCLGY